MADKRTSFPTMEILGTEVGTPIHAAVEGDTATGRNAHGVLPVLDPSGNLGYLRKDSAGNLYVTMDSAGTNKKARGTVTGSTSITTVCDIALTANAAYKGLSWIVSCFRDAIYEIAVINDPAGTPTETILADVLVGSGDLTDSGALKEISFTAGATAPVLRLRAKNLTVASDFRGAITTTEDTATP